MRNFVPAADEVYRLQTGKDPECLLAQKIFEQGHYAGRTQPTNTRQGIYAAAPSGYMLGSINSNDPVAMAAMLRRALDKWNAMTPFERRSSEDVDAKTAQVARPEARYPEGGLALRMFTRDLPRDNVPNDWRGKAWNQDFAWFRKEEVRSMLPAELKKGQKLEVPAPLIRRLARFNFIDIVRGQAPPYRDQDVVTAALTSEVVGVSGSVVDVVFKGATRTEAEGKWAIAGYRDMNNPQSQRAYLDLKLYGKAKFDTTTGRFRSFDLAALGVRYGATQYNGRHDDLGPAPIGFVLVKAGETSAERIAPAHYYAYGWR